MNKITDIEIQSKTIDWLRFPLSVLVIFVHMNPNVNMKEVDFSNLDWNSLYDILGTLLSKTFGLIAVPCFFMFSGYLFYNKINNWNMDIYLLKLRSRLRSLVVPYILFNILAICVYLLPSILLGKNDLATHERNLADNWYKILWNYTSWSHHGTNIFGNNMQPNYGPYVLPLWFLRDLIVMVLISPIVYYWIKFTKYWGVIILFFFYYTKLWIEIPGYSARLFIQAIFYFSLGSYFSIYNKNIVISLREYKNIWFFISLICLIASVYFHGTYYNKIFLPIAILASVVSVVNLTSNFIEQNKLHVNDTLTKSSFFIYCLHYIGILGATSKVTSTVFNYFFGMNTLTSLFVQYFITPFLCAGILIVIYVVMKRYTPKLLGLFTGNR